MKFYDGNLRRKLSFQEVLISVLCFFLPIRLKKILFYHNPSWDVLVAYAAVIYNGEEAFPDAHQAILQTEDRGEIDRMIDEAGDPIKFFTNQKTLVIGAGGSFLDEHSHERNRGHHSPNDCAATLTSKLIGSCDDEEWRKILHFTYQDDKGLRKDPYYVDSSWMLPNLIKVAYDRGESLDFIISTATRFIHYYHRWLKLHPTENAFDWRLDTLVKIAEEIGDAENYDVSWVPKAEKKFRAIHKWDETNKRKAIEQIPSIAIETFATAKRNFRLCIVEASNPVLQTAIFRELHADVVVIRKPDDFAQIYSSRKESVDLSECISELRSMENMLGGHNIPDRLELLKPGKISSSPLWYYYPCKNDMIFNGSRTTLPGEVEPTALTNDQIMHCVKQGLVKRYGKVPQTQAKEIPTFAFSRSVENFQSVNL